MIKAGMTIKEAAEYWVCTMNAIPQDMLRCVMEHGDSYWQEVTLPSAGDRVYSYEHGEGEIRKVLGENGPYKVEFDNGEVAECEEGDISVIYDTDLPMWGTMWSFGDSCDDWWLEEDDGLRKMSDCGFRIYYSDEYGYYYGIDGAGYDFYEYHWVPLYKARGLQWHDPEVEE